MIPLMPSAATIKQAMKTEMERFIYDILFPPMILFFENTFSAAIFHSFPCL
ncbi:hypothetical protein CHCC14557_3508 [Bacillus licheniformis]|nr:hypothetical protein CHCC14557_3508 [Bacillus licheniformis]